jgi:hypothetical protein
LLHPRGLRGFQPGVGLASALPAGRWGTGREVGSDLRGWRFISHLFPEQFPDELSKHPQRLRAFDEDAGEVLCLALVAQESQPVR